MRHDSSNSDLPLKDTAAVKPRTASGSQTLLRGLDVIDAVIDGPVSLNDLAERLDLTRSTTHRLATALIERRYLSLVPRQGYRLGPKLLELGFHAQRQIDLIQIARPHLEALAASSEDTVHLGIRENDLALYLDKIAGRRRVEISSRVGERHPLTSTGLGKALLIDSDPGEWQRLFDREAAARTGPADYPVWLSRMTAYAGSGHAFDLEENEDQIRCVAAPVRTVDGSIIAAISVSSAAQYMANERMDALAAKVRDTARAISADLGWTPATGSQFQTTRC